jgi:purine-binding chemotaxis protein CheW
MQMSFHSESALPSTRRVLRCTVGGTDFCVGIDHIRGIQRSERMRPSGSADGSIGVLSGFGDDIAVYSLAARFGLCAPQAAPSGPILVLAAGDGAWGGMVDRVDGVATVARSEFHPLPRALGPGPTTLFDRVALVDGRVVLEMTFERAERKAPPSGARQGRNGTKGSRPATASHGSRELIVFAIDDSAHAPVRAGMHIAQVAEILEAPPIVPVVAAPAHVLGLANWRGKPVPVVDLASRVGLEAPTSWQEHRIVVARTAARETYIAFPIHGAARIYRLPIACAVGDSRLTVDEAATRGVFDFEGAPLIVPDVNRIAEVPSLGSKAHGG